MSKQPLFSILTTSANRTRKLGEFLATEILKMSGSPQALTFWLEGKLGTGKTTFVQGLAAGLGIKERVLSPSFLVAKPFWIPQRRTLNRFDLVGRRRGRPPHAANGVKRVARAVRAVPSHAVAWRPSCLWHVDLYRLKHARELLPIGLKTILRDPRSLVVLEWGARFKRFLPKGTLRIHFSHVSHRTRRITFHRE